MAYIYRHLRKDNNQVFYIGIGEKDDNNYKRSYEIKKRNNYWKNIYKKYGFFVEIIESNLTWKEACEKEKYWIKFYGRKDLKEGTLVNLTDGGEGGANPSEKIRKNISERNKNRRHSKETKEKIRNSLIGHLVTEETRNKIREHSMQNPRQYWLGKKRPDIAAKQTGRVTSEETKQKQREAKLKNPTKYWLGKSRKGMKELHTEYTCPNCGKIGKGMMMFRWHFDNCKNK